MSQQHSQMSSIRNQNVSQVKTVITFLGGKITEKIFSTLVKLVRIQF